MILAYEFIYAASDAVLENFLYAIASDAKREFYIVKTGEKTTLFVKGGEEEQKAFGDLLAVELPLSIFLRSASVKIADEWEPNDASEIEPCETLIGFTPKTQALAAQSGTYAITPEIGRGIALDNMPPIDEIIGHLSAGENVAIKGKYVISPLTDHIYGENDIIMPTDISFAANVAIAQKEDVNALGSLERPILRLPSNLIFSSKYPRAPRIVNVALAGDLYLYLLSVKLAENGVKAFVLSGYDRPRITALKSQNLIISGTRLSPCAARFLAIKEPHFRVFAAAINERGLQSDSNLGFFFSVNNDDFVVFNSPQKGAIELLKVDCPLSIDGIFCEIAKRDQGGARLIANYRRQYGEIIEPIRKVSLENAPKNVASLWAALGLILGFGDTLESSREKIFEHIAFSGAIKAPSADYRLTADAIDYVALIRAAMSYKLAGVSDEMIAFGLCESLARFIGVLSDLIEVGLNAEVELRESRSADAFLASLDVETPKNIFLIGSLFSNKTISELALNHISPSKNPLFPNALPLEF
jgi:hypothetical protein